MRILDRYLFWNFLLAFVMCYVSMVGLYIVIDLFANADEFLEDRPGTTVFVRRVVRYYGVHSFEYFARLAPIITVVAAMVTLASLHTHNELIAVLAAGVPTRRVLMPVMAGVVLIVGFGVLNREWIIPANADTLELFYDNIEKTKDVITPTSHIDRDKVLFRARLAYPKERRLSNVNVTIPIDVVGRMQELHCEDAYLRVDEATGLTGWLLIRPEPTPIVPPNHPKIRMVGADQLFIASNIGFEEMTRSRNWLDYASTWTLISELSNEEIQNPQKVRILVHNRFMKPITQILLVLLAVPFVLQWERKNIYLSIAVSMVLSGVFFGVEQVAGYFASFGYLGPTFAAWVPVLLFAPLGPYLFQRVGT